MEQGGVGETCSADGCFSPIAKQRRSVALLTIHGQGGLAGDRRIGRVVAIQAHAVAIEEAHACFLDHLGRHVGGVKRMDERCDSL